MQINTYSARPLADSRAVMIYKRDKPAFFAVYVAPSHMPPNQWHTLLHGFQNKRALFAYCYEWGIALAPAVEI